MGERQLRWARKNIAAGLCQICGQQRGAGSTTYYCATHAEAARVIARRGAARRRARRRSNEGGE